MKLYLIAIIVAIATYVNIYDNASSAIESNIATSFEARTLLIEEIK